MKSENWIFFVNNAPKKISDRPPKARKMINGKLVVVFEQSFDKSDQ